MEIRSFIRVEAYGASLDYLTLTSPLDEHGAREFHSFAWDYMQQEKQKIGPPEEATVRGYVGQRVGDTQFVKRHYDGHEMLFVSGERANVLAKEVIKHGTPGRIRRVDVRVLAECEQSAFDYPEQLRSQIIAARRASGAKKRKKLALFDSPRGNDGITIGSRSSTSYLRIYDHEGKHGKHATGKRWAHEIEYKGDKAELFFDNYASSTDKEGYCAGVMRNQLRAVDIPCTWLETMEVNDMVVGRKLSNGQRRLDYCKKVVLPMLSKLAEDGHADDLRDLIKAHGLEKLFKA